MRVNRSLLNWGVFLIALGGIPLAVDQGWLADDIARDLGRLWPLILVGIGLGLILRWTPFAWFGGALVAATFGLIFGAAVVAVPDDDIGNLQQLIPAIAVGACSGGDAGPARTQEGSVANAELFDVDVSLSCARLDVARGTAVSWAFQAAHAVDDAPIVETSDRDGATATLDLSQRTAEDLTFLASRARSEWSLQLPAGSTLVVQAALNATDATIDTGDGPLARLSGTFNASDVLIDLSGATAPQRAEVDVTANAADVRLALPDANLRVHATLNASSLRVCVPADVALQVDVESILSSDDLGSSGLQSVGSDRWVTPGFDAAGDFIDLSVSSTVSSLSVERPESCA